MENFLQDYSGYLLALIGGGLIGLSTTVLLLALGRIAGICGITFSIFFTETSDKLWRVLFIIGLIVGTWLVHATTNVDIPIAPSDNLPLLIIAGLLVGFGTQLGNGCTSGHGICGIARKSQRSIIATITFMLVGFITVYVARHLLGAI